MQGRPGQSPLKEELEAICLPPAPAQSRMDSSHQLQLVTHSSVPQVHGDPACSPTSHCPCLKLFTLSTSVLSEQLRTTESSTESCRDR